MEHNEDHVRLEILRTLGEAYLTYDFETVIPLLADNCVWESQWRLDPVNGKADVTAYYQSKSIAYKDSDSSTECLVVELADSLNMQECTEIHINGESHAGSIGLMQMPGKLCLYLEQMINGDCNGIIIDIKTDNDNKIARIDLCMPEFFNFHPYNNKGHVPDWGKGIPAYKKMDIMTKMEIHDFGVEIIHNWAKKEGYNFKSADSHLGTHPAIIAERQKKVYFIDVATAIAPVIGALDNDLRGQLVAHAGKFNAVPCFASVSIGAADPDRFNQSLVLRGDAFYSRFTGLEML